MSHPPALESVAQIASLRVGGVVLCGGASRRMGRPKAWLPLGGELMLQRVVRLICEVVEPVVVVAAPGQELPPLPSHVQLVRDAEKGQGPLQGLLAGIMGLTAQADAVYASSCDVPFLRPAFLRRMIELLGSDAICVPDVGGYLHPLAAVYRVGVRRLIPPLLSEGRVRALFDCVSTRIVHEADLRDVDPDFATLRNLNTPREYEEALAELREGQ